MKKFFGMVITCMVALGLVSCSAADDDLTGDTTTRVNTVTTKSNLSSPRQAITASLVSMVITHLLRRLE